MNRKNQTRRPPDPVKVRAGRDCVSVGELFTLIHDVNPTGKGLSRAKETEAYRMKAALQSVLVRSHPDVIKIEQDPARPDEVTIRHAALGLDACHARIDELDIDARSWVRARLDLGDDEPASSGVFHPVERKDATKDTCDLADRARLKYDYAAAEELYREALDHGRGRRAVLGLLGLLIEDMGRDDDALTLTERLGQQDLEHPSVCVLLGLAAARGGRVEDAEKFVQGLDDRRVAGVLAHCARAKREKGDLDAAEDLLRRAATENPSDPDVVAQRAALDLARADALADSVQPLLVRMQRARDKGGDAAAEQMAREVLKVFPRSREARDLLGRVADARRRDAAMVVVRAVDAAVAAGFDSEALAQFQMLRMDDLPDPEHDRMCRVREEIQEAERKRVESERVDAVVTALQTNLCIGLGGYLDLAPHLRERVRVQSAIRELAWADALSNIRSPANAAAVVALGRALDIEQTDPAGALEVLSPHRLLLQGLPEFRAVTTRGRSAVEEARVDTALGSLAEVETAMDSGDTHRARSVLDRLARLPAELQGDLEHLQLRVQRAEEQESLAHGYEVHLAAGELLAARTKLDQLIAADGSVNRVGERAELQARIQEQFCVEVSTDPPPEDWAATSGLLSPEGVMPCVDPVAGEMIIAEGMDIWWVVRALDIRTGLFKTTALYRVPTPGVVAYFAIKGDRVFVIDTSSNVLVVRRDTWQVESWVQTDSVLASPTPDLRYLWTYSKIRSWDARVAVVRDLERGIVVRSLGAARSCHPIHGSDGAEMFWGHGQPTVRSAIGKTVRDFRLPRDATSASVLPDGGGLVAVTRGKEGDVAVLTVGRRETPIVGAEIARTTYSGLPRAPHVFTSRTRRRVFVRVDSDLGPEIIAMSVVREGGFRVVYRRSWSRQTVFAIDAGSEHVYAAEACGSAVSVAELGATAPPIGPARLPVLPREQYCWLAACGASWLGNAVVKEAQPYSSQLPSSPESRALAEGITFDGALSALKTLITSAGIELSGFWWTRAKLALERRDVDELQHLLEEPVICGLPGERRQHGLHLAALEHAYQGNFDAARESLRLARSLPGNCRIELLAALLDEPCHAEATDYIQALCAANAALGRGDHEGALAAIRGQPALVLGEVQILAVAAEAYLGLEARSFHERVAKISVLGRFTFQTARADLVRVEARLPGLGLTREQLDEVERRSREWLDAGAFTEGVEHTTGGQGQHP